MGLALRASVLYSAAMTYPNATFPIVDEEMLIGGAAVGAEARIAVRNPACPAEIVGTVPRSTIAQAERAIAVAKAAQVGWGAKTFTERATILDRALVRLNDGLDARAIIFVRENGKTLAEAVRELSTVAPRQRLTLEHAATLDAGRHVPAPNGKTLIRYRPYGVVVSIVPWNAPVSLAFTQIVSALLAGNAVVLKPPESCPLALSQSARIFSAHLPPGVLNFVTGLPSEIGEVLTGHPDVAKVAFTGSIAAARAIMANAAQTVKPLTLELGGNDPAIILDDAELSPAVMKSMVAATFQMSGQVCMAIKRIFVPAGRLNEFIDAFSVAGKSLIVGNGLTPGVTMGPLHSAAALDKVLALRKDAIGNGAVAAELGRFDDDALSGGGYFMLPAIVSNIGDEAPLMMQEQFGPVVPVTTYADVDEAVRRSNDTIFGLSASVWSGNRERALSVGKRLEAGQVWINAHGPAAVNHRAPYGGVKQSGMGRKSGIEGILEYLQTQSITICEV